MDVDQRPILLIEDNEDDVFLFERAYRQAALPHPVQIVRDGQEALDYLTGRGAFADRGCRPAPFLVLLDLKLPTRSGLGVLQTVRLRPALDAVCIVVLTSSAEERDIQRAKELGAQAFLVKPPTSKTIASVVAAGRSHAIARGVVDGLTIDGNMFPRRLG